MTVPTVVMMPKKKNAAREGEDPVALWDALAKNQWNRRRKLLPNLRLRYPTDDELRHIAKLVKVDHPLHGAINSIILDAHLADATYRTLSIPEVKKALNNVANQAIQLAELLSALDIGRGSRGSLQRAGVLIEAELFLQQTKARRILLPKYIDLLAGLSSAARRAAQKPMHLPKGAGGNPAFDRCIESLLMAPRMSGGGSWTNYRSTDGIWKGTLLEALGILEKYLPPRFFPSGELGRSVEHIRKKLGDHIRRARDRQQP